MGKKCTDLQHRITKFVRVIFQNFSGLSLRLLSQDYWKLDDNDLLIFADKYNLLSEADIESINYDIDFERVNPNYHRNIFSQKSRRQIVKELVERTKFATSQVTLLISVLALIISIFSLVNK